MITDRREQWLLRPTNFYLRSKDMSSFVAATVVLAGATAYSAKEAHDARKDAKAEQERIKAEEKKKQDALDAEVAAEKKAANDKAMDRLKRKGHGGTVLAGKSERPSLLGSVG